MAKDRQKNESTQNSSVATSAMEKHGMSMNNNQESTKSSVSEVEKSKTATGSKAISQTGLEAPRKHRPRLFYLDLIRALAAILIIITHFNNPYMAGHTIFTNHPFGIYVGNLGVSFFLIISGAALMYTHGEQEHLDLKKFYWKRFKSIYPMFWIAFVVANAYYVLLNRGAAPHHAAPIKFLFSITGLDGLLSASSITSFYTLGEWFLGFIIIFYLIFPLLRVGVRNHPVITAVIIGILYLMIVLLPWPFPNVPKSIVLPVRLPELVFGMYFVCYMKKVSLPLALGMAGLLVLQQGTKFIRPDNTGLSDNVATTIIGIAAFLVLVFVSKWFDNHFFTVPVASISKYSYPIFLVHHVVIAEVFRQVNGPALSFVGGYLVFGSACLIIGVLSWLLLRVEKSTVTYCTKWFVGNKK